MRNEMKLPYIALLTALCTSTLPAQTTDPKPPVKNVLKPLEIPKDAVKAEDGSYRYTDSKGKKWIYRNTPFGVSRVEDVPDMRPKPTFDNVTAKEDGDVIKFERPGPFGVYKWETKKSDLSEMEKAVWEREKAKAVTAKQQ
jgi:hypothetical protein